MLLESLFVLLVSRAVFRVEPLHGLDQFILLLTQLSDRHGIQARPLLQGHELLLAQLQLPLLLSLGQKVEDPLAGLGVLLEQLIPLLLDLGGLLIILP